MTPAQKAGLKVGDRIRAGESAGCTHKGEVIELIRDDKTDCPLFTVVGRGVQSYYSLTRNWEKIMNTEFKEMKFNIGNDPKLSERVQEMLFGLGYKRIEGGCVVKHKNYPFLYANSGGSLGCGLSEGCFQIDSNEEINIDWLRTPQEAPELIEFSDGSKYIKSELEEALKGIKKVDEG